jgi:hypothetical protein
MITRLTPVTLLSAFGFAVVAGTAAAGPPPSFPGQGPAHASNQSHCHVVTTANAPWPIVNPSEHSGGHAHGAPFTAIPCP